MLFNSINFGIFLPIVFFLYWFATRKNFRLQNILLLTSSYFFYAFWDWRFLFLLFFSTILDYYTGIKISKTNKHINKKFWLWLSILINIGFLGFFKYYNFFITAFAELLWEFGLKSNPWALKIILPLGISFYTFHGLSYILDVYKGKINSQKNFINYSLFVSFFPLLIAGPIERATHLLPQIEQKRVFNYSVAVDGLRQIVWGLFKKIVIADNCAKFADLIFNHPENYSGSTLIVGALFFSFQIYTDFSGYSDIALGVAKLFGIQLLRNFNYPYFSRSIAEFWRRWHISLSSWFRDYVYIPLGGSKGNIRNRVRNIFIIFLLSGFWHGANWKFIAWGFINALYIMPSIMLRTNRSYLTIIAEGKQMPTFKEVISMITTFILITFAWIFFRSANLHQSIKYIAGIFNFSIFKFPAYPGMIASLWILFIAFIFFIIEWLGRERQYAIQNFGTSSSGIVRWSFYCVLILLIYYYSIYTPNTQFIYFEF